MSSAWGNSWSFSWGSSWGARAVGGGGSGSRPKRKVKGWANERAALERSLWTPDEPKESRPAKKRKKVPKVQFVAKNDEIRKLEAQNERLNELELKLKLYQAEQYTDQKYADFLQQDEEEAIEVLMLVMQMEAKLLLGIPESL
jgi:hypothetical protein